MGNPCSKALLVYGTGVLRGLLGFTQLSQGLRASTPPCFHRPFMLRYQAIHSRHSQTDHIQKSRL
jgi:hypothetical protein